jgi:hypothetical protein
MRLEELEVLKKKELRSRINACFETAETPGYERGPLYSQAEFYMRELEHRRDSWVSIRDFVLETVVIILIGLELWFGAYEGNKQRAILNDLQESSAATVSMLASLQTTTEQMNAAAQNQLSLNYEVSLGLVVDAFNSDLQIINSGRTSLEV